MIGDRVEVSSSGGRVTIGRSTIINRYCLLEAYGGLIRIGERCNINPYTILYGHGGLEIGNEVLIAGHCIIVPSNHSFDAPDVPIREQGLSCRGIVIEDGVWIGANVTVLDGVTIGQGAVVGAGAVVTRNVAPMSIVGGVPARILGTRAKQA